MTMGRRNLLVGLGTGLAATLGRRAMAQTQGLARKRLIVVQAPNGVQRTLYRPAGLPRQDAGNQSPIVLSDILSPLAQWKSDVLLIEPFFLPHNRGQHGSGFAATSGLPAVRVGDNYNYPGGITFDRLAGKTLSQGQPQQSINLATIWENSQFCHRSADGAGMPFPAEGNPTIAYKNIFGAVATGGDMQAAARALAREKSLLDFVIDDVGRLGRVLGAEERRKVDQYTQSLRDLETSLAQRVTSRTGGCTAAAPGVDMRTPFNQVSAPVVDAQVDVAFQALACGMTSVATLNFGSDEIVPLGATYTFLGEVKDNHTTFHDNNVAVITAIHKYHFSKIATLWQRLKATPEGAGTMADSTAIVYVNVAGGAHHEGFDDVPFVVVGGLGALRTGRYVELPLGPKPAGVPLTGQTNVVSNSSVAVNDMYVALGKALGLPITTFGDPKCCRGPVPGLA